jgi:hypothetical protein
MNCLSITADPSMEVGSTTWGPSTQPFVTDVHVLLILEAFAPERAKLRTKLSSSQLISEETSRYESEGSQPQLRRKGRKP